MFVAGDCIVAVVSKFEAIEDLKKNIESKMRERDLLNKDVVDQEDAANVNKSIKRTYENEKTKLQNKIAGYKAEADRVQELYLAGHKEEAIATIPDEWIDSRGLMGPPDRIKQRFKAWEDSGSNCKAESLSFNLSSASFNRG